MSENQSFIGIGPNPDPNVPDIPLGLGMALFQDQDARNCFEGLNDSQKTQVINYVQTGNVTGYDARNKIDNAVSKLRNHTLDFFS